MNLLTIHLVMDARSGIWGVFETPEEAAKRLDEVKSTQCDLGYFQTTLEIPFIQLPVKKGE